MQMHPLGSLLLLHGRFFRYAKASEGLSAGKLCSNVITLKAEDTVTVAHAIGTKEVTITAPSDITKNQFKDGMLVVDEGTGAGESYIIASHPAIASGATGVVTLYDGLKTAWAVADTDISLYTNPWLVQEANTDQIERPAGVPMMAVTSAYYFWLGVKGPFAVLFDEAFGNATNERLLAIGSSTAGSVEAYNAACEAVVGQAALDAADYEDAKYGMVWIDLL